MNDIYMKTTLNRTRGPSRGPSGRKTGFTLIELLTVIAVIGVLAAILIPTMSKVRQSANNSRTQAQFSQWITAIESFKQEYGYYPDFDSDGDGGWNPSGEAAVSLQSERPRRNFIEILSGRMPDGARFQDNPRYREHPNRRRISFYSFSEDDFDHSGSQTIPYIVDAFNNNDIVVVVDRTGNGIIDREDLDGADLPRVSPRENVNVSARPDLPDRGIRAGVIIYSAGARANSDAGVAENLVKSWQ